MSSHYTIEKTLCDLCPHPVSYDNLQKEFPELFRDHKDGYKVVINDWRSHPSYPKYEEKIKTLTENGMKKCFYFLADCQGDSISICKGHLLKILGEIDENS